MSGNAGEGYQSEVKAIGDVLAALEPLPGPARERVVEYVTRALGIAALPTPSRSDPIPEIDQVLPPPPGATPAVAVTDIRSLKEAKQPRSANEMAAIVGYYVSELAPAGEQRDTIDTSDLDRFFKQAQYPLPSRIDNTLPNAAAAGYFDNAERGRYRLNPVGYNLVVHNLPSGTSDPAPRRRAAKKGATSKRTTAKKTAAKKTAAKKTTAKKSAAKKTT
jgi:hypothetical protein